jgi:tRNA-splicing ligase RtcB
MAISTVKGKTVNVELWAPVHTVESQALDQLKNIASLPWVFHHVAAMPDVHLGKGATVGSVIAMKGAVAPAAVGVDIGCGMAAIKTNLKASDLPESLKDIRHSFERSVPVGFSEHKDHHPCFQFEHTKRRAEDLWSSFDALTEQVKDLRGKAARQCGSLGGGNHFIELCLDTEQNVWLMLHSGSRNIGKTLAEHHMYIAKKLTHNTYIPDRDLSVFLTGTPEFTAYRHDLLWAQDYAMLNRMVMLELLKKDMRHFFPQVEFEPGIYCHHNYVAEETHFGENVLVTRKGAINAEFGKPGIIPGSMGTKSYIVRGLGNPESFHSASHGAGRRMSRNKAKQSFTIKDLEDQTEGVECRKDQGVLDELPSAYKDIDEVMANQTDLVEVVATLKQVLCVKG